MLQHTHSGEHAPVGVDHNTKRDDEAEEEDGPDVAHVEGVGVLPDDTARDSGPFQAKLVPAESRGYGPDKT